MSGLPPGDVLIINNTAWWLQDEHDKACVADIGLGKMMAGKDALASAATFFWAAPEQLQVMIPLQTSQPRVACQTGTISKMAGTGMSVSCERTPQHCSALPLAAPKQLLVAD